MRHSSASTCFLMLTAWVPAIGWSQTSPAPQVPNPNQTPAATQDPQRPFPGLGQPNQPAVPNPNQPGLPPTNPNPGLPNPNQTAPGQTAPGQALPGAPGQVGPGPTAPGQVLQAGATAGQAPLGGAPGQGAPGQVPPGATGAAPAISGNPTSASFPSPFPRAARERMPAWFTAPGVREQLAVNDQQFAMLQQAYGAMQLQLETSAVTAGSGANPDPSQVFGLALDKVVADPLKRIRYDQLRWQYLGVEALMDPQIQAKLGLTEAQRSQFSNVVRDWRADLAMLRNLYRTEPGIASQQFLKLRLKYQQEIITLLESPQRLAWQQLLGDRFEFDASLYLAPGGGTIPSPREAGGASPSIRAAETTPTEVNSALPKSVGNPTIDPRDNIGRNVTPRPRTISGSAEGSPPTGEGGQGIENKNKPPSNPGALAPL